MLNVEALNVFFFSNSQIKCSFTQFTQRLLCIEIDNTNNNEQ